MHAHRRTLQRFALIIALPLFAACTSFAQLEANDPGVDEEEVFAAGSPGATEHLDNLHHVLANRADYKPEVVAAALTSVGEIGDSASVPWVTALSNDPDEEIRWHVAATLRRLGGTEADDTLVRMATSDPSELVRDEASQ